MRSHGIDPKNSDYLKRDDGKTNATLTNSRVWTIVAFILQVIGNFKITFMTTILKTLKTARAYTQSLV